MKLAKPITIFDAYHVPADAHEFVKWVTEILKTVPGEHPAFIELSGSDNDLGNLHMWYERPETDEEQQEREKGESDADKKQIERELAELERLKRKYVHE